MVKTVSKRTFYAFVKNIKAKMCTLSG